MTNDKKTDLQKPPAQSTDISGGVVSGSVTSHKKRATLNIVIIVLILAAGISGFFYNRHHNAAKKAVPTYSYTYKSLSSFKLPGISAGHGLSVSLPSEFLNSPKPTKTNPNSRGLLHILTKDNAKPIIAAAYVNSYPFFKNKPPSASTITKLSKFLQDPKSSSYKNAVKQIQTMISVRYRPVRAAVVTKVTPFVNANIKKNAWVFDFTVSSNLKNAPRFQGQLVHAFGKTSDYYFTIDTADYNWQPNQAIWQQVIDSLKIDQ